MRLKVRDLGGVAFSDEASRIGFDRRLELKMLPSRLDAFHLLNSLGAVEVHPPRIVRSLYFDNADFRFFWESEEGIADRFKLRLRSYGEQSYSAQGAWHLEVKLSRAHWREKFVSNAFQVDANCSALRAGVDSLQLSPKVLVLYSRRYFESDGLRFTLDGNISASVWRSSLVRRIEGFVLEAKLPARGKALSIVGDPTHPFGLRTSRFSKYCAAVEELGLAT
jgi:hypothetical protein